MPWNPEHYMKTKEIIEEPFVSQWYWQTAKIHPYRKSKAFYHGPRIDWMHLMEESGQEKDTNKKD